MRSVSPPRMTSRQLEQRRPANVHSVEPPVSHETHGQLDTVAHEQVTQLGLSKHAQGQATVQTGWRQNEWEG